MAPGQAVQQHDSFHNAVSKRKQLNMIIVDKCKEIEQTYGATQHNDTRVTEQVTAANKGIAAGWSGRIATDCTAAGATAVSFSTRTASAGASSSRQAAGASADAGSSSMAGALTSTAAAAAAAEHSTTMGASKTWLLPRQAGDREAGMRLAAAVRSKRTPSGAFANLDLAKAPVCRS